MTTYFGKNYEIQTNTVAASFSLRKHIFLGSTRICSIRTTSYYHTDHLGSSNIITDDTGKQLQLVEYTPYGRAWRNEGTEDVSHKFTGQELDASTGLYYYGARYYDAEIGRFISADPTIQHPYDPQDLNRYAYCRNNPINYVDPTGLGWFSKFWNKVSGFVGAALGTMVGIVTGNPYLGMAVYSAISASGQRGNFGKNFGVSFASGLVGWGIGAGVGEICILGNTVNKGDGSIFTFFTLLYLYPFYITNLIISLTLRPSNQS